MGKVGEEGICVDKDFKVVGMQNLRVVDMSVAPFLPRWVLLLSRLFGLKTHERDMRSAHLQAVAYLIGETAAEKIIAEYL